MTASDLCLLANWWHDWSWTTILIGFAYLLSTGVALLIISQNRSPSKTLAYLLLFFLLPYIGVMIYFVVGENYRKKKIYKKKLLRDTGSMEKFGSYLIRITRDAMEEFKEIVGGNAPLVRLLLRESRVPLTVYNEVKLLLNGEQKFPVVLEALNAAKHHIHIEYYIFEEGAIAEAVREVLIRKSREGVIVRLIYDDFGSDLSKSFLNSLRDAGVNAVPFYKIYFPILSNRHNYRNHRKIIIVDGQTGFVGGINISDRYANNLNNKLYWRDTHLRIRGDAVKMLQSLFMINWNFCADDNLTLNQEYFPDTAVTTPQLTQIVYSGPDSDRATIMLSYTAAINDARKYIFLATPYFVPNETILTALKVASFSGVDVRLVVPGVSDSILVNAAAKSYYEELLEAGVRIYLYEKGFMHAKTMVTDDRLSMVGSANMDIRSFDLNFEVNAVVYDEKLACELRDSFLEDLKDCKPIHLQEWANRPGWTKFGESCCRLFSPVL